MSYLHEFILKTDKNKITNYNLSQQLGDISISIINEILKQSMRLIASGGTAEYFFEKTKILSGILNNIFDCSGYVLDYFTLLCIFYCTTEEQDMADDKYLSTFIDLIYQHIGYKECIRFKIK